MTATQAPARPRHVFSKISRVPDLLSDGAPIVSLYVDAKQVLHMQCRLKSSGFIVLFPVTFRLVNRYLNGCYTLDEVVAQAPCEEIYVVTRRHNLLPIDKEDFDTLQLECSGITYPAILTHKVASIEEIRLGLHACMRA